MYENICFNTLEELSVGKMVRRCGEYAELIGSHVNGMKLLLDQSQFELCASTNPHQDIFIAVDDVDKRFAIQVDGLNQDNMATTVPLVTSLGLMEKYGLFLLVLSF